jgi:hypothetical protein
MDQILTPKFVLIRKYDNYDNYYKLSLELDYIKPEEVFINNYLPINNVNNLSSIKKIIEKRFQELINTKKYNHNIEKVFNKDYSFSFLGATHIHIQQNLELKNITNYLNTITNVINSKIIFVNKDVTYKKLLKDNEKFLKEIWDDVAWKLLSRLYYNFNDKKRFIKNKYKNFTCKTKNELKNLNINKLLSFEDFKDHEKLLLQYGLLGNNTSWFLTKDLIDDLTDEKNRLILNKNLKEVLLNYKGTTFKLNKKNVTYKFQPSIINQGDIKNSKELSSLISNDKQNDKIIFNTNEKNLFQLFNTKTDIELSFGNALSNYLGESIYNVRKSRINMNNFNIFYFEDTCYCNNRTYYTHDLKIDEYKDLLYHLKINPNLKIPGRRKEIHELFVKTYFDFYKNNIEKVLNKFFTENKFIIVQNKNIFQRKKIDDLLIPKMNWSFDYNGFLSKKFIKHFIKKHIRGGSIIDPTFNNNNQPDDLFLKDILENSGCKYNLLQIKELE